MFSLNNLSQSQSFENLTDLVLTQLTNDGCNLCQKEASLDTNKELQSIKIYKVKNVVELKIVFHFALKLGSLVY